MACLARRLYSDWRTMKGCGPCGRIARLAAPEGPSRWASGACAGKGWLLLGMGLAPAEALAGGANAAKEVSPWMLLPFGLLLCSIAILPLTHKLWWEKRYPWVAGVLGAVVVGYYALIAHNPLRMGHTLVEYVSFIALLTALFVISGGIHIRLRGRSTPVANVAMLALGAVLANVLGTTGASMLLIRPYLRLNKYRAQPYHVVFFIFIVSNMGGALTPVGDPPLFLGYLKGVPFFWVLETSWAIWLVALAGLLAVFYALDWNHYRRLASAPVPAAEDRLVLEGAHNVLFLFLILAAVLSQGTELLDRFPHEIATLLVAGFMLVVTLAAYRSTSPGLRAENEFHFRPIIEVAIIFAGIFATMTPALDYAERHARDLGLTTVGHFFWATGALSAVLDNAPTYLNSLAAVFGLHGLSIENPQHMQVLLGMTDVTTVNPITAASQPIHETTWHYVQAVSISAVFFGAMTYIGNGPNFMVRSVAEHAGVKCPSYFGYVLKYAAPILLPLFFVIYWLFFRG